MEPEEQSLLAAARDALATQGFCAPEQCAALVKLQRRHPADPDIRALLGQALAAREDWDALAALLEDTTGEAPTPAGQLYLAKVLVRAHRYDEAAALIEPLLAAEPADTQRVWIAAYTAYHQGRSERCAELLDGAWARLMEQGHSDARILRGLLFLRAGDHEAGVAVIEPLLREQSEHVPANNLMGRLLAAMGRTHEAAEYLERARQAHDRLSADETRQARLSAASRALAGAWDAGRLDECERLILGMLPQADPGLKRHLYVSLSEVYRAAGRLQEAEALRTRSVELEP